MAAYGRRRRRDSAIRIRVVRELGRIDSKFRATRTGDYLEFVPGSDDPAVLADLAARINWYLADRTVPIYMSGAAGVLVRAEDAPYMDPPLVRDPGWEERRPAGRAELVVHDVRATSLFRYATSRSRVTLASPWLAGMAEWGWFDLQRRFGTTKPPGQAVSAERLLDGVQPGSSAFVLGTGPSANLVDPGGITADVRIVCNSIVKNDDLLRRLAPDVIAFADPVFHSGPSRYAAEFRRDLVRALETTDAVVVSGEHWINPVLAHHPEIAERIAVVGLTSGGPWHWPSRDDFSVRTTGNVLTLLMLPTAFALADDVEVAGCDGRQPSENYFWKHNVATQYSDETMQAAFAAHPGFFRDRDYVDYYDEHCAELEELITAGERGGKSIVSATPSFIPALASRARETTGVDGVEANRGH